MKIKDILKKSSMKNAALIAGNGGENTEVTSINILEAADIEKWGKKGMIILSSYYALQHLNDEELDNFFHKLSSIGISGLIVKTGRLLNEIPQSFIELCNKYKIPLIEVNALAKYEDIFLDVLEPILNEREHLLSIYYKVNKISSDLSLEMLDSKDILIQFREYLELDLTIYEKISQTYISTNPDLEKFTILNEMPMKQSDYMNYNYKRYLCRYRMNGIVDLQETTLLVVDISCIREQQHLLIIHEGKDKKVTEEGIIVIENLIRCLQLNLQRIHSMKQYLFLNKNTLINDLLTGLIKDGQELISALYSFNIDVNEHCKIFMIQYLNTKNDSSFSFYSIKNKIRNKITKINKHIIYYTAQNYDEFILHTKDNDFSSFSKKVLLDIIQSPLLNETIKSKIGFLGSISENFEIKSISKAHTQTIKIIDLLQQNHYQNVIEEYSDLGIFKLFLETDSLNLVNFVPEKLLKLYKEDYELFRTLYIYIKNNKSYTLTAKEIYLHPKTVKYRINQISKKIDFDLDNFHDLTILSVSIEVLQHQQTTKN